MFAKSYISRAKRRGVVLILILGMMGLLALIGVTFATLSGQARINARNYMQAQNTPDASELMDFALSQLIEDTGLPTSALRGHSLLRDMYGNDARNNGFLVYSPSTGIEMHITVSGGPFSLPSYAGAATTNVPYTKLVTDIAVGDNNFYGYDFTRWTLRLVYANGGFMPDGTPVNQFVTPSPAGVAQTFEIVFDDNTGNDPTYPNQRVFYVSNPDNYGTAIANPSVGGTTILAQPPTTVVSPGIPFVLDGRYLRAFNGPGMSGLDVAGTTQLGMARYGNFRVNGGLINQATQYAAGDPTVTTPINEINYPYTPAPGNPDGFVTLNTSGANVGFPSMDEDYDACDLENWFLALQSADGQVIIPSFHRPGILRYDTSTSPVVNDWQTPINTTYANPLGITPTAAAAAKILRPRAIDGHNPLSFPDLIPKSNGQIDYDVDNDGDGKTDSVWLDLGYAPRRDASGKLFKPLFAFMVIGLNGRLPLNTVGNLSNRTTTGVPQYTQATHLGNSPSEIDPTWALQNAPAWSIDPNNTANPGFGNYFQDQADNAGSTTAGTYNTGTGIYTPGDNTGTLSPTGPGGISVAQTQLRNLLSGTRLYDGMVNNGEFNFAMSQNATGRVQFPLPNNIPDVADNPPGGPVVRNSQSVPGRWGDQGLIPSTLPVLPVGTIPTGTYPYSFQTPVAPGIPAYAYVGGTGLSYVGGTGDDNLNAYDYGINAENQDLYDPAGGQYAAVERLRRFVSPVDVMGDGQVLTWNDNSGNEFTSVTDPPVNLDTGGDKFGRLAFFKYFRPPGFPLTLGTASGTPIAGNPVIPDETNNLYHGYEGARNPKLQNLLNPVVGGMPYNYPAPLPFPSSPPSSIPTFDQTIFSYFASNNVALGNMNEPDEVNLYDPSSRDQIFGPGDLEWLYRQQDSDGASLNSRLAQLAPVSFTNALDGLRRRRLFSLESWETTNSVWAYDNPLGAFATNARFGQLNNAYSFNQNRFDNSASRFNLPGQNTVASAGGLSPFTTNPDPLTLTINQTAPTYSFATSTTPPTQTNWYVPTPAVAHRDRKINLNFPLPVSNVPTEPVRQKWIRETYQLLKAILPPKAVDTPLELAQLSQYVTNIIDFRDPDCTTTRFVNTDLSWNTTTAPPTLTYSGTFTGTLPTGVAPPLDYNPNWNTANSNYLVQYGMEYPPIAINEVLAFSYKRRVGGVPTNTPRMFVEVVNTLTESLLNNAAGTSNACDLDLKGWDFVVLPEGTTPATAAVARPDPVTGQIPYQPSGSITSYPVNPNDAVGKTGNFTPLGQAGTPIPTKMVPALSAGSGGTTGSDYFYVFANDQGSETLGNGNTAVSENLPTRLIPAVSGGGGGQLEAKLDLTPALTTPNSYYWLYLRRPANPFDDSYNPSTPNENRVVVDSFRFYYNVSNATVDTSTGAPSPPNERLNPNGEFFYSLQRMQPYRGGQMVADLLNPGSQAAAYGYSEQTTCGVTVGTGTPAGSDVYGKYNGQISTYKVQNTLGSSNKDASGNDDDAWDTLVFHDRDFTSVAELMMVPGCPPGLFTKQFCEMAPPITPTPYVGWITTYGTNPPTPTVAVTTLFPSGSPPRFLAGPTPYVPIPHTFPYLVDNFFYSGASEFVLPQTPADTVAIPRPYVGGPSGAGWSKMFEFFEVPSPAIGATGQVAQGNNFDWFRQDRKPGLLNLNLIIDEEVFLGLMGFDSSDNYQQALLGNKFSKMQLNMLPLLPAYSPMLVTQLNGVGNPVNPGVAPGYAYQFPNNGAFVASGGVNPGDGSNGLKAAFTDFLKIVHGGTSFLFGMSGNQPIYRPFHSLSYPDLNYTVMRPAVPPPPPGLIGPTPSGGAWPAGSWPYPNYTQDPALKNPYLAATSRPVQPVNGTTVYLQPPPIPTRRLFQVPDAYSGNPPATANPNPRPSNANALNYPLGSGFTTGDDRINIQPINTTANLYSQNIDLTASTFGANNPLWLGNHSTISPAYSAVTFPQADMRQHPYFRSEWMQRVMNLSTVRTHQFAVWITVGLFEVTQAGDPQLAATNPALAYDRIGLELGALEGTNVRYRGFFLLDRTRAAGFNPSSPGDFRDVIVYRKLIE